ncbi:MAG: outer membrane lipoprotein carrier protein LolA [Sutterella wadsworthensis]|nr:outer membrane lipoprotein carrier protein LolA [Sutterella wadsworthensis]
MRTSLVLLSVLAYGALMSAQALANSSVTQVATPSTNVAASSDWDRLAHRLGDVKKLSATFTQTRWLGATGQTLTSTGTLDLDNTGSFTWTQMTPFKQVVRLKDDAFSIQYEDEPAEVMTKTTHPAVWAAAELLAGVMRLDVATLNQHFTGSLKTEGNAKESPWTATLIPKDAHLKQLLGTVVVSGDSVVRAFSMSPNPDNRTDIKLTDIEVVR